MLVRAIFAALRQVVSPPLRRILWRSLGLTALLLGFVWVLITRVLRAVLEAHPISAEYPVVDGFVYFLTGAGLLIALGYVMPAVTALVAGYFLDDVAAVVERTDFPGDRPGEALSVARSLGYGLRFGALALFVNFCALVLFFVPGINVFVFFAANAYLFSREYFEMAAARFRPGPEAVRLREANAGLVTAAGIVVAGFVLIPIVNLATPIFGIALMVHVHKAIAARAQPAIRAR